MHSKMQLLRHFNKFIMNQFLNKKTVIILLVIVLIAVGFVIMWIFYGPHKTLCSGIGCRGEEEQQSDLNIPFSKGPTTPPKVGTPNIPLPE